MSPAPPSSRPDRRRPARPPSPDRRADAAQTLARIAGLLVGDTADAIQNLRAETMAVGYPTRASGADGGTPGNEVDEDGQPVPSPTSVERAVCDPDPAATQAISATNQLNRWLAEADAVLLALEADSRTRTVKACLACGTPWDVNYQRCQGRLGNGAQCLARFGDTTPGGAPLCANPHCGQPIPVGDLNGDRHKRCASYLRVTGRERPAHLIAADQGDTGATAGVARLHLDDTTLDLTDGEAP